MRGHTPWAGAKFAKIGLFRCHATLSVINGLQEVPPKKLVGYSLKQTERSRFQPSVATCRLLERLPISGSDRIDISSIDWRGQLLALPMLGQLFASIVDM